MELSENTILLLQEAVNSYIEKLKNDRSGPADNSEDKDKIISLKCNIRSLEEAYKYLEDKKRASRDSKVRAQQIREAVEENVKLFNSGFYDDFEKQDIYYELQKTALYIIQNIGVNIPPLK